MIDRYARPELAAIWSEENRFRILLEIEACAAEAMAEQGTIPHSAARAIGRLRDASLDVGRIREIEKVTRHETLAFLEYLAELAGDDQIRHLHRGMTSSDALDTCLNLQLTRAAGVILASMDRLLLALRRRAFECRDMLCIGRSHGVHAEPTTLGIKLAQHHAEFSRGRRRIERARDEVATAAISGPVGTFATIEPGVEAAVCRRLGLRPEPASTQIVPRDRHAQFFCSLAVVASSAERLAVEIRNLQRTEILEVEERFATGQKGSSAMPHKRNPILSENVTGLARIVRAAAIPALENVVLWHERDMTHSSVERIIGPDATTALDFLVWRLAQIVGNMNVYPDNMARNLALLKGVHNSHRVLDALVASGLDRSEAYAIVQDLAMQAIDRQQDYRQALAGDPAVTDRLSAAELEALFDDSFYARHVGTIFERVFGES